MSALTAPTSMALVAPVEEPSTASDHADLVGFPVQNGNETSLRVEADAARSVGVAQKCRRFSVGVYLAYAAVHVVPIEKRPVRHRGRPIGVLQPIYDDLNLRSSLHHAWNIRC